MSAVCQKTSQATECTKDATITPMSSHFLGPVEALYARDQAPLEVALIDDCVKS